MSLIYDIVEVLKPFWCNNSKIKIIAAVLTCIFLEFINVGLSVYLNYWYIDFYDSLATYNHQLLVHQVFIFAVIMMFFLINSCVLYVFSQLFAVKIRKYLTIFYTRQWLYSDNCLLKDHIYDNPDERLSNDIRQFVYLLKTLFLGFVVSIPTFIVFSYILWSLSGSFELNIFNYSFVIYGYLFWIALALVFINILIVIKIGRPLRALIYEKQKYEANFRFGLARLRMHNSDGSNSFRALRKGVDSIVDNFYQLTFREAKLNIATGFFSQIYGIVGIFLSLPRYFAKAISFGQVMQINSAFLKVVTPLLFFVYSYSQVAELKANTKRVLELKKQIE